MAVGSILAVSACSGGEGGDGGGKDDSFAIGVWQPYSARAVARRHRRLEVLRRCRRRRGLGCAERPGRTGQRDLDRPDLRQRRPRPRARRRHPAAQAAAQAITTSPCSSPPSPTPREAGLVDSSDKPGGNVTGTSDLNPVEEQLKLVKDVKPDAKTVGIVYSSGEVNSQVQVDLAKEAAKGLDVKIKEATIAELSELAQAVESLGKVDAYYVPTDNNVVSAVSTMVQAAEKNKALLVGSEAGQVESGAAVRPRHRLHEARRTDRRNGSQDPPGRKEACRDAGRDQGSRTSSSSSTRRPPRPRALKFRQKPTTTKPTTSSTDPRRRPHLVTRCAES